MFLGVFFCVEVVLFSLICSESFFLTSFQSDVNMTINQQQLPLHLNPRGLEDLELALRRCKNEVWELGRRQI